MPSRRVFGGNGNGGCPLRPRVLGWPGEKPGPPRRRRVSARPRVVDFSASPSSPALGRPRRRRAIPASPSRVGESFWPSSSSPPCSGRGRRAPRRRCSALPPSPTAIAPSGTQLTHVFSAWFSREHTTLRQAQRPHTSPRRSQSPARRGGGPAVPSAVVPVGVPFSESDSKFS